MRLLLIFSFISLFALDKISLQLDWKYQFEFAGYIVAKEKGFYKEYGLDVELVEYHNNNIIDDVISSKYDFGIYDNTLIEAKLQNKPVKLVASIFKRSALVLVVSKNIKTLKQLENKTLMVANKEVETFKRFLEEKGVDISTIKFIPHTYSVLPFIQKKVDGFSAYLTNEPYLLDVRGVKYNIINPSDYGALMYQGELFTNSKFAHTHPVLVDNFKKATIKGWEYALEHKLEVAKLIYNNYSKRKSIKALLDEANKLEYIIQRHIYPIGYIDKNLIRAQFAYYRKTNIPIDIINDYIFEFQNPLNLSENYLWLIKFYNFHTQHHLFFKMIFLFLFVLIPFIIYYYKTTKEKEKIETLFNKAPVAYVLMDVDKRIVLRANNYAYKLFEYPKEKPLMFSTKNFHISEESFNYFRELFDDYVNTYSTIEGFNINYRFKTYNNKILWLNVKSIKFSQKEILWVLNDISDIMHTKEKLSHQIIQTQKAMRVKEEFLANMSHEIRTPLNAILGFVDIIYQKEKDPENIKYLSTIKKAGEQLLTIINDILDFSKIESNKLKIEHVEFNPTEEFETIVTLFESKAKEKNINLHINLSNLKYNLISDPTRIKQIISNLISNAIKFTPPNKNVICNITYNSTSEKLYIEVIDEGIGIPKNKIDTIFDPFAQADTSTTRKYGGTGLGLAISKKLVELLGGKIKVDTKEGRGSRFYFSIPAKKRKLTPTKKEVIIDKKFNGKVLVVEDNKANQLFAKVILNSFGIKDVDIANDGIEALEKVKSASYDLILMDENMPNMNGIVATRKIRQMHIDTPIVAVTANALTGDRERFLSAGMDDYISKPIDKQKLIDILSRYLEEV